MREFTPKQIAEILAKHQLWLDNKEGGERANLSGSDLRGSNLSYSDLRGSNLSGSDLRGSNLSGSDLSGSDLRGSNLSGSDLSGSNLRGSNLSGSDLRGSNLSYSNLSGSDLRYSNLRYSNLRDSDLSGSDLRFMHSADGRVLACMNAGEYQVVAASDRIAIGCQMHSVEDWLNFDDAKISRMDNGALEWWKQWKELVFAFHKNIFGETK